MSTTPTSKEKVIKQAAIHRASKVAASTKEAQKVSSPSAFSQISKALIELQMIALQAQLTLLEELEQMSDEEKMETLFSIMDKDRDGSLTVVELADGLRKIRGDVNFEESLGLAMTRIAQFDKDGDAKLDLEEFKKLTDAICEALGANFHELSEMLIISVVFSDSGNDEVEEFIAAMAEEDVTEALKEETKLAKIMNDERMKALFHMFDLDADGSVTFAEVATGVYKITHDVDEAAGTAMAALLLFDDDGNATLEYEEFTRFILKLIEASGSTFDESILTLTKVAAEPADMTTEEIMEQIKAKAGAS
mmetsp:Transcript_11100/g.17818  ORF Transcript_11100/g.17818 Transcript_11100/m.17818 type:complete len:307 (-) Transcript_11100:92-1012(-)